ncbi:unnamed protein product, partial [Dovyalis caffra]
MARQLEEARKRSDVVTREAIALRNLSREVYKGTTHNPRRPFMIYLRRCNDILEE